MIRYTFPRSEPGPRPGPVQFSPPIIPFKVEKVVITERYPADQKYVAHNMTSVMTVLVLDGTLTLISAEGKVLLPEGSAIYIERCDGYQWLPENGPVTLIISSIPGWQQANQRIVHKPKEWSAT